MRVSTIMPLESVGTSSSPQVKIIYVRMKELHESIAIELFESFQQVPDIVMAFHELAFNKAFTPYVAQGTLVCMRKNAGSGIVQEVPVTKVEELQDREVLVYRPCEELRSILQQEFFNAMAVTSSSGSRSRNSSRGRRLSSSQMMQQCLKRKGRATSVANNDERILRYAPMLDTMEITAAERQLIEELLRAGDEQMNDALQQYSIGQNVVNLRRVLQGQSKKRYETLEGLSDNFSQLDVEPEMMGMTELTDSVVMDGMDAAAGARPVMLNVETGDQAFAGDNPFLMGFQSSKLESIPASPIQGPNGTSSPARPSLALGNASCATPNLTPKTTPATTTSTRSSCSSLQRLDLSLEELDTDDSAPTFVSISKLLDQVPVQHTDIYQQYDIGKVLGSGKYSVVKEATKIDDDSHKKVAIKIVEKYQMMEVRFLKRELEIMYSLHHEGIVELYELYENAEQLFLVMELCGMELFDHLDVNGPLDEATTKRLIRRLVQTVDYLHSNAVVHRDIKPENILIVGDDVANVKLADFGIARRLEGDCSSLTPHESLSEAATGGGAATPDENAPVRNRMARAHTKCGTRDYVAPEVMSGKGYGTEADMWSVGIVTFVLMTGVAPVFLPVDGVKRVQFPEEHWAHVSKEMKQFVDKLLTRNPEERMTAADALKHCWLKQ